MNVQLSTERAIAPADVLRLYSLAAWWPRRTEAEVEAVIAGGKAVGAWDGDCLVGFARFISDGSLRAYIEDVVVDPSHRHKGVGTALMQCLLNTLSDIDVVSLFCDEALAGMYERNGFVRTGQIVMHHKRRAR